MPVDTKTLRLVVLFLGAAVIALIAAIAVLTYFSKSEQALDVALGTALGALAALFVSPHSNEPTPVSVVDQPVTVTERGGRRQRPSKSEAGHAAPAVIAFIVVAGILVFAALLISGVSAAQRHHVQEIRACVGMDGEWVRGDCINHNESVYIP